jgi:TPP-dependent pyruvate/acetoin dehydrogenase alpha subunit
MAGPQNEKKPRIRAGMGDVAAEAIEAWRDDDYRRATGLLTSDGDAVPPGLAPATLRDAFGAMLFARALGGLTVARAGTESPEGRPVADPRGREAAIAGVLAALAFDDMVVPGRAELAATMRRGPAFWREHAVADFLAGKVPVEWRQRRVLPPSQQSGTQLPHAMGIAWAIKMQQKKGVPLGVALSFLDASETSAEDFHAALNFAGVYKVPVIFVCINVVPVTAPAVPETVSETLAVKALAYAIAGTRVDGGDLRAAYAATSEAVERARGGGGATLIEAVVEAGALTQVGGARGPRDPIERTRAWLAAAGVLDAAAALAIASEIDAQVAAAVAPSTIGV